MVFIRHMVRAPLECLHRLSSGQIQIGARAGEVEETAPMKQGRTGDAQVDLPGAIGDEPPERVPELGPADDRIVAE